MQSKGIEKVKLTSFDDLFGVEKEDISDSGDHIVNVPISMFHTFKNHPFHVVDDMKMEETVQSIKKYGVLVPGIVRQYPESGYEIVSGHRRWRACELAGLSEMPVIIKELDDDEATIIMVDSNIQREDILPSEKAKAYRMKFEAMKHQGSKGDKHTADLVGESSGECGRTVYRYIRLTYLIPQLLAAVDDGKLRYTLGETISYLSDMEQEWVWKCVCERGLQINGTSAEKLKVSSQEGKLTELSVELILTQGKKEKEKVTLPENKLRQYFPKSFTRKQMEQVIFDLLAQWKEEQ